MSDLDRPHRRPDIDLRVDRDGIAWVTICRPRVHNALRPQSVRELADVLTTTADDPAVRVVALRGQGSRAFCSGLDQSPAEELPSGASRFPMTELQLQLRRHPKPTVAMVNGHAIGGGNVLQLLCDFSIASSTASFAQPGLRLCSVDGGFGVTLLSAAIGSRRAREMWLLGRTYTSSEAAAIGLVNRVVPDTELEDAVLQLCRELATLAPAAIRLLKASFNAATDGAVGVQQLAHEANRALMETAVGYEARAAYLAHRQGRRQSAATVDVSNGATPSDTGWFVGLA